MYADKLINNKLEIVKADLCLTYHCSAEVPLDRVTLMVTDDTHAKQRGIDF